MRYLTLLLVLFSSFANAATYYVDAVSGSDSNNGTSTSTPWQTVSKVETTVNGSGDAVYFKCGTSYGYNALWIDWANAIVGAYNSAGNIVDGSTYTCGSDEKPTFYGDFTTNSAKGTFPADYGALVIAAVDGVTIQDLYLKNSSSWGISTQYDNVTIQRNKLYHIFQSGIFIDGQDATYADYPIVRDNYVEQAVLGRFLGLATDHGYAIGGKKSRYGLYENNIALASGGEGIAGYKEFNYNIIVGNTIAGNAHPAIYLDNAANNVVEKNMIVGKVASHSMWDRSNNAIAITIEEQYNPNYSGEGNIIRNNLITNVNNCFYADVEGDAVGSFYVGFSFVGNTCTYAGNAVSAPSTGEFAASTIFKNNIFDQLTNTTSSCTSADSNISFDYNNWVNVQSDTDCVGVNDTTGTPPLNTTDFSGFNDTNLPTVSDFGLDTSGANNANDVGVALTSVVLATVNYPQYTDMSSPWDADDLKLLYYDYEDTARTTVDIGAVQSGGGAPPSPDETLPFKMNIGAAGASGSYETEQYTNHVNDYTGSHSDDVANTTDDAIYQSWRGSGGSLQWNIPIAGCDSGCDLILMFSEQYWGDESGTCAGGERTFSISAEGDVKETNYDICLQTGAVNTAIEYRVNNIILAATDILSITLGQGTTGADTKPELAGLRIEAHVASGDTLSVANSTPSTTKSNNNGAAINIDPITLSGATTTAGTITILGNLVTTSLTGTAIVDETGTGIMYTPPNSSATGSMGSLQVVLTDGVDSTDETITISITLNSLPYIQAKFTASQSDIEWEWCNGTWTTLATASCIKGLSAASSDSGGIVTISDDRLSNYINNIGTLILHNESYIKRSISAKVRQ